MRERSGGYVLAVGLGLGGEQPVEMVSGYDPGHGDGEDEPGQHGLDPIGAQEFPVEVKCKPRLEHKNHKQGNYAPPEARESQQLQPAASRRCETGAACARAPVRR